MSEPDRLSPDRLVAQTGQVDLTLADLPARAALERP
jgi:hypothetical protein